MFYKKERECISVLMKNYDIPKKVFIQAAYERNGLKELVSKLE